MPRLHSGLDSHYRASALLHPLCYIRSATFAYREGFLPPKEVTGPDARGIKTEIEYAFVDGKKMKTTRRIRVSTREVKVSAESKRRRARWAKFGKATKDGEGVNKATTMTSYDEILIEDPADAKKQKDGDVAARHDSAEDFSWGALLFPAMAWIFIPVYCFTLP